ncbi:putative short chain type dehydrogenase [Thozetella sp. PMI_491]|nr:putative short chain type dehydrogenase [Thozetella sp. PMI_491]
MTADTLSLQGKVAIVTGSGRENGIGAGIACALARNGAQVVVHYVSDTTAPRASQVVKKIQALGGLAVAVQANILSPEAPSKLVQAALDTFKTDKIDILGTALFLQLTPSGTSAKPRWIVNNAWGGKPVGLMDAKAQHFEESFGTAVFGPVFLMQAVVPKMPRGGRIINISSIETKMTTIKMPLYAASKAAMDVLSATAAFQLGRDLGININSILAGPVTATDMVPPGRKEMLASLVLPHTKAEERVATVEDIADAVLLLVSEQSRWITGQSISVSGGILVN